MAGIFISYRRDDTSGHAVHLHRDLVDRFGRDRVFMDITTLEPGLDFGEALERAVSTCDVLLAVIGPRWLTVADAAGRPRLEDPDDFVRREVATTLARQGIRVIPVLVGNAPMPPAATLPEPLKALADRHAFEISDERWTYDVGRLVERLNPIVGPSPRPWPETPWKDPLGDRWKELLGGLPEVRGNRLATIVLWTLAAFGLLTCICIVAASSSST